MTINFYYHWLSPPSRIVYLVIKNLKIDANYKVVDLTKREQKTSEYLKVS